MHQERASIQAMVTEDAWIFALCREISGAAEGRRSMAENAGDALDRDREGSARASNPREYWSPQNMAA